jgi:hypothetical protein
MGWIWPAARVPCLRGVAEGRAGIQECERDEYNLLPGLDKGQRVVRPTQRLLVSVAANLNWFERSERR